MIFMSTIAYMKNRSQLTNALLKSEESDKDLLHPLIVAGAAAMEMKLCEYAKDYLPGGLYWNPNPHVREIMTKLKPTNDLCESLLGFNDYLSGAMPNDSLQYDPSKEKQDNQVAT